MSSRYHPLSHSKLLSLGASFAKSSSCGLDRLSWQLRYCTYFMEAVGVNPSGIKKEAAEIKKVDQGMN